MVYEKGEARFLVRVWLEEHENLERSCQEQAYHLSQLPFLHKWVCLMPGTYVGMGMPIRGVIATNSMIILNTMGVDIGYGMTYTGTNIKVDGIREIIAEDGSSTQIMVGDIIRNVPVGFIHHKTEMPCYTMGNAFNGLEKYEEDIELLGRLEAGSYQIGILSGGNRFTKLQADGEGYLCVMIHSGSRHIGRSMCDYFHSKTRELDRGWYGGVPDEYRPASLPIDTGRGRQYLGWMQLSMNFVEESREKMMLTTRSALERYIGKYADLELKLSHDISYHYDYTVLERHYDKDVWVHRRDVVRTRNGELVVTPGVMSSHSYVVIGKGNPESSYSSSHGAGRHYFRRGTMAAFSYEEVVVDLQKQGIILGKKRKADVMGENRFAYRDIQEVMNNQPDPIVPVKRLRTIGVVKG